MKAEQFQGLFLAEEAQFRVIAWGCRTFCSPIFRRIGLITYMNDKLKCMFAVLPWQLHESEVYCGKRGVKVFMSCILGVRVPSTSKVHKSSKKVRAQNHDYSVRGNL